MEIKKTVVPLLFGIILASCGGNSKPPFEPATNKPRSGNVTTTINSADLYAQKCMTCHGADGTKGFGGAKSIPASQLTLQERIDLITHGKNTMPAFKGQLTDDEIKAVAEYSLTLK